jgi:hypothetical protein
MYYLQKRMHEQKLETLISTAYFSETVNHKKIKWIEQLGSVFPY